MIPVKLAMRNFMCYREGVPTLSFESIHTACISGNNGNGKSAIVDAMTWALWGQARANSDDELVHAGQTEMEVEFEFAVGEGRYRILRKRSKPKHAASPGKTILELQAATGDGYKPITGDTVTQTQQKINQLLRMDYDTFINSAFLRQGHADEFTKKRPGERKQVLASILQLAVYDELEESARNRAKELETELGQLESAVRDIEQELARKPEYQAEFDKAHDELSQAEKLTKEQEAKLASLRQQKEALESKKTQLAGLESRIKDTERNRNRWDEQARQHLARSREYEAMIAQRDGIEAGYARFLEGRKLCQELDQKLKQVSALGERKHRLDMAIVKAGQALNSEHRVIEHKIKEMETASQKLPQLQNELSQVQSQSASGGRLAEAEARLQERRQAGKELQAQVSYLKADRDRLEREIAELKEKLDLLSVQGGAQCPLCESDIGVEGRQRIEAKYLAERESKTASLKSKQTEAVSREAEAKALEAEISQLEAKLSRDRAVVQTRAGALNRSITEAEEARDKLTGESQRLAEIEQLLTSRQFAVAEQEALAQVEAELARLDYNPEQHDQARERLSRLEPYEPQKRKLEEADRLIAQEKKLASDAEATALELRNSLEADNQNKQELIAGLKIYPQVLGSLNQAEDEFQALLARQKHAQEVLGGVKAKLERCAELETRKKEKESQLREAEKLGTVYRELAQAFGKKGIQAMLIEMALPEIENEANKLLSRMTDNRMHVKMETQRATKKGDVLETLDINISDELGTRNYEMFSGGEAFRIDFAIRIALSKLLAHRAGAALPTLIIDEGFGTQDSTGIDKLKEAINSIQDDFQKILVITHIAELRDAFPTRIEVVKTAEGSTIEVS